MNADQHPGRHRAPGGHSFFGELRNIARQSGRPALKTAVAIAATGGLVATLVGPAQAAESNGSPVAAPASAPAVVGPEVASTAAASALTTIGLAAPKAPAKPAAAPKQAAKAAAPLVIKDVVVEAQRAAEAKREAAKKAAKKAAAKKAAAEKAAKQAAKKAAAERAQGRERASRTSARQSLSSSSTSTQKATTNTYTRAATGQRASRNWGTPGQCTWGALNLWHQATGFYPGGWTGNALVWANGAARAGHTVSSVPRARSIVVLQPGVHGSSRSAGHVGWVTSVSGNRVTITEMNALAGPGRYNTRTLTHVGGMRYIYAP